MATMTKTYGVEGLADWQCVIKVGKARAVVHFEGGMMTRFGITPAEYTTSDLFKQTIIEGSDYFKSGRIKLLRQNGTGAKASNKAASAAKGGGRVDSTADTFDKPADVASNTEDGQAESGTELLEVEVACLTDAQNYLKEHFGIASSKIRSWDKAHMAARENGVIFKGVE